MDNVRKALHEGVLPTEIQEPVLKSITILAIAATLSTVSTVAMSETVKRNMLGCITEELLDEATRYAVKGDRDGTMQLILAGKCVMLRAGETVSVISPGFAVATVRYKGTKLYTPSEAIR